MAKTNATRSSKRQSSSSGELIVGTKEDAPKEEQDEQDHQMDTVIEVKGRAVTASVSLDKKNKEGEVDDQEKGTNASDQMMDSEKETQIISSADAVDSKENTTIESAEMKEEMPESGESQMDIVAGSTATVAVTWEKNEEGESEGVKKETNGGEQMKETPVKGKRKASSSVEASPSKKTKLLNDGYCLYVGNLNNSKTFDEVKDSLANYFTTQSLLVQDIRLDRSKKHAFVDLASEMDLTKGLTLNGEMMHDKPMKIAKAKVKSQEKVQTPAKDKKAAKDDRCLFLKNVPYDATKKDILKIFQNAVNVRFPDGTEGPTKGVAFVEFKNKATAQKVWQQKQGVEIQGRLLIVDCVGKTNVSKVIKAKDDKEDTKAGVPPNNTLFVSHLPYNINEKNLEKVFQTAVGISVPKSEGKSKGFAFVTFAAVEDAEKALQSSQNMKISKKAIRAQFCKMQEKSELENVQPKTLVVMGLAEKTTAETLKSAFEGALSARVTVDKETGVSKRFGFVDFESEDKCKAVKVAMEDCEIDGSKVTVAYAKANSVEAPLTPGGQPAGQGAGKKRKRKKRKGKKPGAGTPQDAVKEVENKA
ncbi:nucleolin-like [Anoplopoma fimbria]|uniref:nucleolin-like n=1 Tax=Anoplopoma fimbria TaxID=229290 RepID=UPI0023EC8DF3|nr:nucleolin-like [Anoplopoma fimbria]